VAEQSYKPNKYVDFLSDFSGGVDSGVSPLLLKKNQLSMAVNASLRFGFIHPRSPFVQRNISYNGQTTLINLMATGLFQGAGYYRPDSGTESLLAAVSGHLIKLTEINVGGSWSITDVSVPGNLNSATQAQSWMWQSELWMIVNDGSGALPIFFSGSSSRRSYGPAQLLGNVESIADSANVPDMYLPNIILGQQPSNTSNVLADCAIVATLDRIYTGPYNAPVIFNGEYYMVTQSVLGYPATLTNVNDTAGNSITAGAQLVVTTTTTIPGPQYVLATSATVSAPQGCVPDGTATVAVSLTAPADLTIADSPYYFPFGVGNNTALFATIPNFYQYFAEIQWQPISGSGSTWTLKGQYGCFPPNPSETYDGEVLPAGLTFVGQGSTTTTTTVIDTTSADFTVPAVNGQVTVYLTAPYEGPTQNITINGKRYTISQQSATSTSQITLVNLTDPNVGSSYNLPIPVYSVPELPAGKMGAYGNGRNWFSLVNGITYEAGDIVGGGSGTPAYNYRDGVLKTTENDFMVNGGVFTLPGTSDVITAMIFPPVLDSSMGVGSLQVFTPFSVFANNAPADRATWAALTWPIQSETLKDQGALAQDSTVLVNSDCFFRGDINFGSLVLARRQFQLNQWGNKPISDEMQRVLQLDNQTLLNFGCAVSFDNRFLGSVSPSSGTYGVSHLGVVTLNFDPLSSLRTSDPPVWEGAWEGLNIFKLIVGRVNGTRRCFAFTYNNITATMELWELLDEATSEQQQMFLDNGTTPITWMFETPVMFNQDIHSLTELIQLRDGEVYLSEINGTVNVSVYYRPDFYPCWTLWRQFTVCADQPQPNSNSTYRMRVGLGEPSPQPGEIGNNRPLRVGYFFQLRFVISGYCNINGVRASAITAPEPVFAPVNIPATCDSIICTTTPDMELYSLQNES
jgi:hypothetical protein